MSKKKIEVILLGLLIIILLVLFYVLLGSKNLSKESGENVTIGFISTGNESESGWNKSHIDAIKTACEELEVPLHLKENIKENTGECVTAAKELIEKGVTLLFLNSYNYGEELKYLIKQHPEVYFYVNNSEECRIDNLSTYFARMYQVRYLSGLMAGMKTQTDKIGYVAAMNNNEVNRGINAFTLGVKKANPDAVVVVAWTGSWDDATAEKKAVRNLVEKEKIDVVTYHQNQPNTIDAAEEEGIYSIGYHQAYDQYSKNYLTSAVADWKVVYREIIKEYRKGKAKQNVHFWVGLEKDAVMLTPYSGEVTAEMEQVIKEAMEEIKNNKDVFSGEIYDNDGQLKCGDKETISDINLLEHSDWFVEGVTFFN